jgi:prolyl 4-hydroxylase
MNEGDRTTAAVAERRSLAEAVAKADDCDAAGNHGAAIDHLARGARLKDVDALTRLGKRLLAGDRAPALPSQGAGFLAEAVELGGAEAAAVLAVVYGIGASRRHGPADALDTLTVAAERGWPSAQAQLRVLAAVQPGAASDEPRASEWRRLRARIDLAAWQSAPNASTLSAAPVVRVVPKLFDDGVCRWLIEKARGRLTRALVYEALSKRTTVSDTRNNTAATFGLLDTDVVCVLAQNRMAVCAGVPFRHLEPMAVLHYAEGEEITEHFDFVDPHIPDYERQIASQGQRIVTFLAYLNDDYGGGETEFPEVGLRHKGRRGEGLYFVNALADGSADTRTLHAGRAPTHGEKWIVSQFMRNRPTF